MVLSDAFRIEEQVSFPELPRDPDEHVSMYFISRVPVMYESSNPFVVQDCCGYGFR